MIMRMSIHMPQAYSYTHLHTCPKHAFTHVYTSIDPGRASCSNTQPTERFSGLAGCGRSRGAIPATYNIPCRWSENYRQRIAQTTTATGVRNIAIDDTFRAAELRQSVELIWAPILSKIKCLFFWSAGLVVACLCRRIGMHVNDND